MSSQEKDDDDPATSWAEASTVSGDTRDTDNRMKRAAAKQLIERYYYQLTDGCGQEDCNNAHCASSHSFAHNALTRNQAAVQAITLFTGKAQLCDSLAPSMPSKVAKSSSGQEGNSGDASVAKPSASTSTSSGMCVQTGQCDGYTSKQHAIIGGEPSTSSATCSAVVAQSSSSTSLSSLAPFVPEAKPVPYLTETSLHEIILNCEALNSWSQLIRTLGSVFNNPESLMRSFLRSSPLDVSKEERRSMEVDMDKDRDENEAIDDVTDDGDHVMRADDAAASASNDSGEGGGTSSDGSPFKVRLKQNEVSVDIESLRRAYRELFAIPGQPFQGALLHAISSLSRSAELDLRYHQAYERDADYINIFVILFEIPLLDTEHYIDHATMHLCKAAGALPMAAQAKLARVWSQYSPERLKSMVGGLQQLITIKVIGSQDSRSHCYNDDDVITSAARVMKILFYAVILGGRMDEANILAREHTLGQEAEANLLEFMEGAVGHEPKEKSEPKDDPLGKLLGVDPIDCRAPRIPWEDFINEPLSEGIKMDKDYTYYKAESEAKFTFMTHSFLLTTAVKSLGMYFDNRIRMVNERRTSLLQSLIHGAPTMPYLRLRIRRDHIIDDALVALEMVAMDNPQDLKKQLYVEFDGEQGIDEGGVSKEFFQLVVEEIFNPDIGMFVSNEETRNFWFNSTSFETDGQFTLIGIMLGLAIYNNVILDIRFPMVVYRKLLGKLGTYEDLQDSHPTLSKSLKQLLDFDGDVEETFMQTYSISYTDVFGSTLTHNLKDDGDKIPVTKSNRQEYVDLYANFLLNKAVEKQFRAFKRGFQMVTDESPLKMLFHPKEVELLVCGSDHFDFKALEEAAEYDAGFTELSPTIRNFWIVVHEFTEEQKRKLLQFATGSDRVPVGGLSKLKLVIARNGPDSDRLPTAHTCFNVLLLPEYGSLETLKERLLKAINYAKGFGML